VCGIGTVIVRSFNPAIDYILPAADVARIEAQFAALREQDAQLKAAE